MQILEPSSSSIHDLIGLEHLIIYFPLMLNFHYCTFHYHTFSGTNFAQQKGDSYHIFKLHLPLFMHVTSVFHHQSIEIRRDSIRDSLETSEHAVRPISRATQCKLTKKQCVSVSSCLVSKLDWMPATYILVSDFYKNSVVAIQNLMYPISYVQRSDL